jgi:hypothetical protein
MKTLLDASDESESTPLQVALVDLDALLARVRATDDERLKAAFGRIAEIMLVRALGAELIVDEAECALAEAA